MLMIDLRLLILMSFESLKMVEYSWSYAVLKFDDEICFCSILVAWLDSMKMNDGFLMCLVCWSQ